MEISALRECRGWYTIAKVRIIKQFDSMCCCGEIHSFCVLSRR